MSSINPTLQLWPLIQSHRVTAVIYVAAKLGILELLRDGPLSVNELAKSTGADKQALDRLLVALSTIGIKTAAQLQGVSDSFDLMARNPEAVSIFYAAMVDLTRFVTPDVLRAYDFGR